jgi:thiamine biosynthesis lipoprotein
LLQLAQRIHQETSGAFDITVAPLIRCWGFMGGSGTMPGPEQIDEARAKVGMQHVILDENRSTIRFAHDGMMIDLGSIGKGYALEVASEVLREAGLERALIHGGTSTICAIGAPPVMDFWKVALEAPPIVIASDGVTSSVSSGTEEPNEKLPLAVVSLKDESLSVSGVHGKCFRAQGKTFGHVIDPRTGYPAQGTLLAAVVLPSATETDAFSTALLLGSLAGQEQVTSLRPGMRTLVAEADPQSGALISVGKGIEVLSSSR